MSASEAERAIRFRRDGYAVRAKSDGRDYWRIMAAYLAADVKREEVLPGGERSRGFSVPCGDGELALHPLSTVNPNRRVFRAVFDGGTYVLKWASRGTLGLGSLTGRISCLTYFGRLFGLVRRAVDAGCAATQDYLLVAEKPLSPFRQETLVLLEYVEGEALGGKSDLAPYREALREAMADLAGHGLTIDDISPFNFLAAGGRIRVIDLSCRPPTRLNVVKMIMKMNARYGLDIPVRGAVDNLLRALLGMRYAVRGWFGKDDF